MINVIDVYLDADLSYQEYDVEASLDEVYEIAGCIEGETYSGATTIIPSKDVQILNTNGCIMTKDIVVKSIPSNYGLITWNGSVLTVS